MKYLLSFLFLLNIVFMVVSCSEDSSPSPSPPVPKSNSKESNPVIQEKCKGKESDPFCEKNEECKKICDDIFSDDSDEKACYKLPESLIVDFKELIASMKKGLKDYTEKNTLEVLECLLDLDTGKFVDTIREMSGDQVGNLLINVAKNGELARILNEEDERFDILKQALFRTSNSRNLRDELSKTISENKSFLWWLLDEDNEQAWRWLDAYVREKCSEDSTDCPGRKNIEAYCRALTQLDDSRLKEFLQDADLFEVRYKDEVEDAGHDYLDDFRNYCEEEHEISDSSQ